MRVLNRHVSHLQTALLLASMSLLGCAAKPDANLELQRIEEQKQLKDKIELLEVELAEWHEMKAGLSRLIVIEGDLKLLVEQLTMLAGSTPATATPKSTASAYSKAAADKHVAAANTKESSSQSTDIRNTEAANQSAAPVSELKAAESIEPTVKVPKPLVLRGYASAYLGAPEQPIENNAKVLQYENKAQVSAKTSGGKGDYALQLSSVDKFSRIEPTWFELQSRFSAQLGHYVPKYERVLVKGKTYYRIKVGLFTQHQQALSTCKRMQKSGLECIVATSKGINLYSS
ncbi:SPOR domain-containing protein [Shewanella sp. 125m-7]